MTRVHLAIYCTDVKWESVLDQGDHAPAFRGPVSAPDRHPVACRLARFLPGQAIIETVGRHSGAARKTPVGGRLEGSTFWLVSEFGRHSNYVRNIDANPHVRVQVHGEWHAGTATVLDNDEPRQRLKHLPRVNSLMVRLIGTDLLTLRIDLEQPLSGQA